MTNTSRCENKILQFELDSKYEVIYNSGAACSSCHAGRVSECRRRQESNFKWLKDPLNFVKFKNPFGCFQTTPQANAWQVPIFFSQKKGILEHPNGDDDLVTIRFSKRFLCSLSIAASASISASLVNPCFIKIMMMMIKTIPILPLAGLSPLAPSGLLRQFSSGCTPPSS